MKPDIREVEPGVYSILWGGRSYQARVLATASGYEVELAGQRIAIDLSDPRDARRNSQSALGGGRQNIAASMPGKVVKVLVAEGDTVAAGQGLIVVEAMKMQNELKAAKPGRVVKIQVQAGATVTAGQALIAIE